MSRALRRRGFSARDWDLLRGNEYDLTRRPVQRLVKLDAQRGLILGAMLAPPCSSFSPARDRTRVIRSRQYPWGIPGIDGRDGMKLETGNRCLRGALDLVRCFHALRIPWIWENPRGSKMWYVKELCDLENDADVISITADFCQFGKKWRKRTKFLCGHIPEQDLARLSKMCQGKRGVCSATGCRHFQLSGSNKRGMPWTRIAQPYPGPLCEALAHALVGKARAKYYSI